MGGWYLEDFELGKTYRSIARTVTETDVVNFAGLPSSTAELKKITFLTKKNVATGKNNMLLMNDGGLPYVEQDMLKSGRVCATPFVVMTRYFMPAAFAARAQALASSRSGSKRSKYFW